VGGGKAWWVSRLSRADDLLRTRRPVGLNPLFWGGVHAANRNRIGDDYIECRQTESAVQEGGVILFGCWRWNFKAGGVDADRQDGCCHFG